MGIWGASTLSSPPTLSQAGLGGEGGAGADCEAIISAVDTSLMSSNTDMYTVVYDPDMHLQPQDVPTSRIAFTNMSTSRLSEIVSPQGPRTPRNHA